jgi:mutator protein MutT
MSEITFAIAIFYDKDLNIIVQKRGTIAKMGEKYAFWGGRIEEGETPEQAVKRELIEELNYRPPELEYWGDYSYVVHQKGIYDGYKLNFYVFISPITPKVESLKVLEGEGIVKIPIQEAIEERGFLKGVPGFMPELKKYLQKRVGKS